MRSLQLIFVLILLLLSIQNSFGFSPTVVDDNIKCIDSERHALLMIKQSLVDDYGHLSSWGNEEGKKDCCHWRGVSCSNRTGHVVKLNLQVHTVYSDPPLRGNISSSLRVLQHLNYLDLSWNDFKGQRIPEFIGSLNKLRYLDLSRSWFSGRIPHQLGNLSRLRTLDLGVNNLNSVKLDWLSHLSSLRHVRLGDVNLSEAIDWMQVVSQLPYLTELELSFCNLPPVISSSISLVNSSKSLSLLSLSWNKLPNSIYPWLSKFSNSLVEVDLGGNNLQGPIPDYAFENMTSLMHLHLRKNQITGTSKFLSGLCRLKTLFLDSNNLTGSISDLNLSGCTKETLESLSLTNNMLSGSIPDFSKFLSMRELTIGKNKLNGTISETIGKILNLEVLDVSSNLLEGTITEDHMSNLSELREIDLSHNLLTLEFSSGWVPPFQLHSILLAACKMGPHFPKWLQTQKNFSLLDISDARISDMIPTWFWNLSPNLYYLNMSYNHMKGMLPDLSLKFSDIPGIYLGYNDFEGPIPLVPSNASALDLSKNKFSGSISFLCSVVGGFLNYLDLSDNLLSGEVPDCFSQIPMLQILNLANNNFSGMISGLNSTIVQVLNLRNNSFTGEFPLSLNNLMYLNIVDVGDNRFFGKIPAWIGDGLPNLVFLNMRSNQFTGSIPLELCRLSKVQVLDFSSNNISGVIPKCISNLTAMIRSSFTEIKDSFEAYGFNAQRWVSSGYTYDVGVGEYVSIEKVMWKGTDQEYKRNLGYLRSIDLSNNKLIGEIPEEITSLKGLRSLNLSKNQLTGPITPQIGELDLLDSLDLSNNQLSGEIPASFSSLNFLGVLHLCNNNLSGKIPTNAKVQNFDASSYMGNPKLCGSPLQVKCPEDKPAQSLTAIAHHNDDGIITMGFYVSLALGFIAGFLGVTSSLVLNESWRHAYFRC